MIILPSSCFQCRHCKNWKPLDEMIQDKNRPGGIRRICKMCFQKDQNQRREWQRNFRLKKKFEKVKYDALVQMCIEYPDIFEKAININPRIFRSIYKEKKHEFFKKEEELAKKMRDRPQNGPGFMADMRKKKQWKKPRKKEVA